MQVKVMNRTYKMNRTEYEKLLQVAKKQVPFGIYAVEKNGYAELRNDQCDSMTKLKTLKRQFKREGFRVCANESVMI